MAGIAQAMGEPLILDRWLKKKQGREPAGEGSARARTHRPQVVGATALLVALAAFAAVVYGDRGLWSLLQLHQERKNLSREVETLHNDIASLKVEYREYGAGDSAIERAAREELNLVKPGEIVYKFGSPRP